MEEERQPGERLTAGEADGRGTGALFFLGFGTLWVFLGLRAMHDGTPLAMATLFALAALLLVGVLLLFRWAKQLPAGHISPERRMRMQRVFMAVNIIQWVAVLTAVAIFSLLHLPEYIAPAIAIIVGLHLFPLATAFRYPQHNVTGALLVAWALGCLAILPRERLEGLASVGTGVILLASAAATLGKALSAARAELPASAKSRG